MSNQTLILGIAAVAFAMLACSGAQASPVSTSATDLGTGAIRTQGAVPAARELVRTGTFAQQGAPTRLALSSDDYFDFSGIGAIVCSAGDQHWTSTAFFVGAFDVMVTSADAFSKHGMRATADNCVYTNSDSQGRIREEIPVAYFKSQWEMEDGAAGDRTRDLAVVKLKEQSAYAQKTLALAKFDGKQTRAFVIAFRADINNDTMKTKSLGVVYPGVAQRAALYSHDIAVQDIAAGAPVINAQTGAIIGLCPDLDASSSPKSNGRAAVNDLVIMNAWLETTLRAELKKNKPAATRGVQPAAPAAAANDAAGASGTGN